MSPVRNRIQSYGYAGLIPFFAGAALVWVVPEELALSISHAFVAYACIILSFLGGVVWRPYIGSEAPDRAESLAMDLGIVASLIAWALLLAMLILELAGLELVIVVLSALAFYAFRRAERKSTLLDYASWFEELRDFLVRAVLASHFSIAVYLLQQ